MCQNIKTFLTGIARCDHVAKSESYLNNINSALNTASDIRASIDSKRKELFQSADYTQGRSKLCKTWGSIIERRRRELSMGVGGHATREILIISLSENVFPGA